MKKVFLFLLLFSPVLLGQIVIGSGSFDGTGGGGAETGEIFADDFEDGTLDAWTANNEGDNTITIATDTVNSGTYSAFFDWQGVDNVNYIEVEPTNLDATKVYFRMYLRVNHFFRGTIYGAKYNVISFFDGSGERIRLFISTGDTDENPDYSFLQWSIWCAGDTYRYGAEQAGYTHNTWLRVELGWSQADSIATVKVDGVEIVSTQAADQSSYFIDKIRIGNFGSLIPTDSSSWYVDDVVIDSTGWVGAKP